MFSLSRVAHALRRRSLGEWLRTAQGAAFGDNVYASASLRVINDYDAHWPTAPRADDPDLVRLHRDGYVNLGNLGIDVAGCAERAGRVFDRCPRSDSSIVKILIDHPFLFDPLPLAYLKSERVNKIVRWYLGDDATFDDAQLSRLPDASSNPTISGLWHHDGVGHVLYLWVLLHDLDERGRATWYATGSHHRSLLDNRLSRSRSTDAEVRSTYPNIIRCTGKRGDAFLTDAHGWHRATFEPGSTRRDSLYLAFSSHAKARALRHPLMNHGIGIVDELFPGDFDPAGTLLRRERLTRDGPYLKYTGYGRAPARSSDILVVLDHDGREKR
jgi:hypothetical protein